MCTGVSRTDAPADDREDEPGREEEVDAVGQEAQDAVCGVWVGGMCRDGRMYGQSVKSKSKSSWAVVDPGGL